MSVATLDPKKEQITSFENSKALVLFSKEIDNCMFFVLGKLFEPFPVSNCHISIVEHFDLTI